MSELLALFFCIVKGGTLIWLPAQVRGELQAVQWTSTAPLGSCLWWQRRLGSLILLMTLTGPPACPPGLWVGLQGLAEMSLRLASGSVF